MPCSFLVRPVWLLIPVFALSSSLVSLPWSHLSTHLRQFSSYMPCPTVCDCQSVSCPPLFLHFWGHLNADQSPASLLDQPPQVYLDGQQSPALRRSLWPVPALLTALGPVLLYLIAYQCCLLFCPPRRALIDCPAIPCPPMLSVFPGPNCLSISALLSLVICSVWAYLTDHQCPPHPSCHPAHLYVNAR